LRIGCQHREEEPPYGSKKGLKHQGAKKKLAEGQKVTPVPLSQRDKEEKKCDPARKTERNQISERKCWGSLGHQ